jgi:predicted phage terminase large subunit-like protein
MSRSRGLSTDRRMVIDAVLRTDFYAFVQAIFPIVSGGSQLMLNWHLEAMAEALSKVIRGETRRLIITVPPRSLKSICASVALPAFVLGLDPTARIICVSYSEGLARKHANDWRAVMRSPHYRRLFPGTRISSSKDTEFEVMTTARGFRRATSVGGTLTGLGANFIIIDDPMKPQDAQSESARQNLLQWYANTLMSRLDNKATDAIVVVMQRLHPDDLVGHLIEQDGWTVLNLPAIAEIDEFIPLGGNRFHHRAVGSVLHPEREPLAVLNELKQTMGSLDFSAQYQQRPIPVGGNLVKWAWFRFYDEPPAPLPTDRIIVSWDTAMTSSELADYSACVVLLVRGETVYVLDVYRARLDYPDLKRKVIEIHQRWRRSVLNYNLIVENKGSGMSLIQDLRYDNIYAIGITPDGDKAMRMSAQTARIEEGSVLLPKHSPWLHEFCGELLAFPASRHSDQVDAFSQPLKRAFAPPPRAPVQTYYSRSRE